MNARWDYMTLRRITGADYAVPELDWLRSFGTLGWELTAMRTEGSHGGTTVYYFKRLLLAEDARKGRDTGLLTESFIESGLKLAAGARIFGAAFDDLTRDELVAVAAHGWDAERKAREEGARSREVLMSWRRDESR